jgi:hypothetical protein
VGNIPKDEKGEPILPGKPGKKHSIAKKGEKDEIKDVEIKAGISTLDSLEVRSGLKPGDKVYFENIRAVGPDKTSRNIGSLAFVINN